MATISPLDLAECLKLLSLHDIGRIAVVDDGCPVVFPVNYRLSSVNGLPAIAIRTRKGGALDHPDEDVGFQIDAIGPGHDAGWSVLVRGRLARIEPEADLDPRPLVDDRDAWRLIVPRAITGRRVLSDPVRWPFHPAAYL